MKEKLLNVGYGNVIVSNRIISILTPGSSPMKRFKEDARKSGKLINATHGRKTRAIIITDSDHVILSAVQPETICQRLQQEKLE
ncbi:MAG: DUF370 domain-containing protein [bacterium]